MGVVSGVGHAVLLPGEDVGDDLAVGYRNALQLLEGSLCVEPAGVLGAHRDGTVAVEAPARHRRVEGRVGRIEVLRQLADLDGSEEAIDRRVQRINRLAPGPNM